MSGALDALGYSRYVSSTPELPSALNFEEAKKAFHQARPVGMAPSAGVSLFAPWPVPLQTLDSWLDAVTPGQYLMAHLGASVLLPDRLRTLSYKHITILRDPRALLAALLFEEAVMPRFLRAGFAGLSPAEQLAFFWNGGPVPETGVVLLPYPQVYRSLYAWQYQEDVLVVRFEDMAEQEGLRNATERMACYLDLPLPEGLDARLALVSDPSTRFFHSGRSEEGLSLLPGNLGKRINTLCRPLCDETGYA